MRSLVRHALLVLALALSAASLIPLVPTEWWWVRLLDFPRLPFALGLLAVGLGLLFFLRESPRSTGLPPEKWSSLRYGFEPCGGCHHGTEEAYG